MNAYSIAEMIKTGYSLLVTKLTMPEARLIRRPVYIRGRQSILGCEGLTMGRFCRFDLEGNRKTLFIGKNCEFGDMTHIVAHESVEIGNNVLIASKCFISDTNHGNYKDGIQSRPNEPPRKRKLYTKSVKIGNNVWIGENVVILGGSIIGDGSIIGANSMVNTEIPRNSIAVGSPAKCIKKYDETENIWRK
jgi:acetyltransferase-like isoleucine patch superfamily enzyme